MSSYSLTFEAKNGIIQHIGTSQLYLKIIILEAEMRKKEKSKLRLYVGVITTAIVAVGIVALAIQAIPTLVMVTKVLLYGGSIVFGALFLRFRQEEIVQAVVFFIAGLAFLYVLQFFGIV